MSRIGNNPIVIPDAVQFSLTGEQAQIKGPKGTLAQRIPISLTVRLEDKKIIVERKNNSRKVRSQHGVIRTLLQNMVTGVTQGFTKRLELQGVGYKAQTRGKTLVLNLGYTKPIEFPLPPMIEAKVEGAKIAITGADKAVVGQVVSQLRELRAPEPYKGKGLRVEGERVIRKVGKSSSAA